MSILLQVKIPEAPVKNYAATTWEQLKIMASNGIEIGGHTRTHPVLTSIPIDEAEHEIRSSKERIENKLGCNVVSFAYPNGMHADYNDQIKRIIQEAGYLNATVAFMDRDITSDLFELRRYSVGKNMRRFKNVIFGVEYLAMSISHTESGGE